MRAKEFTIIEKKRRKRRKNAAYGPGPFGGYGYAAGYSGDGGVGEASYPGNIGMMEVAKFFKIANDAQKKLFKELLEKGKRGLAWKLVQDVTGTELQGQEFKEGQEFNEGVDTNSAIKSIVATADSITKVYRDMKAMAENMYDNTGKLKGFKLTSAGIGKRWYDTFFWNRMSSDLYVLLKENPKAAGKLREFFDTLQNDQGHISFSKIEYALPRILNHIGKMLGNSNLENFATNWIKKSEEYHSWLQDLQDKIKDEEDEQELEKPASTNKDKTPNIIGQQNSAAEDLVNQILKSLDRRIAGEIRNAIARDSNKLQALQRELAKRNIKLGENFAEGTIDIGSEWMSVDVKRRGGAAGIAEGKFDPRTGGQTPRDYSPDSDDFKTPQEYEQAAFRENPWQAVVVDRPGFLDFEVQLTNPLTQQQLNFIMRPVDMITSFGGGEITPDTFDVRDLQTGKTTQWDSGWGMPMHHTAAWFLWEDDPYLQKELQKILAYYKKLGDEGENAPEMPGLVGGHQPAGQSFSAQDVIDSGATDLKDVPSAIAANKAAAAIAKAKAKKPGPGVAEGTMDDVELYGLRIGDTVKVRLKGQEAQGDIIDIFPDTQEVELLLRGALAGRTVTVDVRRTEYLDEQIDIGSEWMSDTELDQYVPDQLEQEWRELVGYDEQGNVSALWANMTGHYEPDVNDPQDRANMVKVANKWFAMKRIPNVRFYDVRDVGDELEWLVQIGAQGVAENFADGRVKGRSRPGRVKRSGASCKGSVTDLRARAKKYGGERGKMYHWCANMKGGKK